MTVPVSMRAAVLYDVDDLRVEERPVPRLQDGDLLVKIEAAGICSGDLMPWYIRKKAPLVLGHEPAGTVVDVRGAAHDRDGRRFACGDRVAIHHHAPCMHCVECARGEYVQCATWRATAIEPGGIAEYVRVPNANLIDTQHVSAALPAIDAVLVEPLGCVVKSLTRARLRPNDTVYVIGLGVMGLLHVMLARRAGHRVFASDFHETRRRRALQLGADAVFEPDTALDALRSKTGGRGAECVICGPGSPQALQHAVDAAAPAGTVMMFTPLEPGTDFTLDQSRAYFRDLSLVSSYSCGPDDTREALRLLEAGAVNAAELGAVSYALDDAAAAYADMAKTAVVKSIVTF